MLGSSIGVYISMCIYEHNIVQCSHLVFSQDCQTFHASPKSGGCFWRLCLRRHGTCPGRWTCLWGLETDGPWVLKTYNVHTRGTLRTIYFVQLNSVVYVTTSLECISNLYRFLECKKNIEMHDQFIGLSSDMAVKSQSFQSKHLSKIAFMTLKTLP